MFEHASPESAGVRSKSILRYIKYLEKTELSTHDVIIARGDKIIYENYWVPFNKDFLHRMYSVTKSFVSVAIGFLVQDGKLSLDDKIVNLFPSEITEGANDNMKRQTIRNMLMMSTGHPELGREWFDRRSADRVRDYFSSGKNGEGKFPGSFFDYDSPGSFVLGALAERLSGMKLLDYLREKCLDKIGFSKEAYCLTCPGGHSWGDSALLCTPKDLLKFAKFVMNLGSWNGEQLLNSEYLRDATSNLISTPEWPRPENYGYGYLIWQQQDGFRFDGMGCQYAVCIPKKDIILIYNGDNQGIESAKSIVIDSFYNLVANEAEDAPLPENTKAQAELENFSRSLVLHHCTGDNNSSTAEKINGKKFFLNENPMGITDVKFTFSKNRGVMEYTNGQGHKELPFAFNENVFTKFPQGGYSDLIATERLADHYYKCAVSAKWLTESQLYLNVQITDKYFGRLHMYFSFTDEDTIHIRMNRTAEDFLDEYQGKANGKAK